MSEVIVAENVEELNRLAAGRIIRLANEAIDLRGRFTAALSGGSTPKALFRLLASNDFKGQVDWSSVFFFFGDERCVPPEHPDSNYRMAKENLFDLLEIAPENILRWPAELPPKEAAAEYEKTLHYFFEINLPKFDLVLLGLGTDGHTASLFPFTEALDETEHLTAANHVGKLNSDRLTFTYQLINNAANIIFLAAGEDKATPIRQILEGSPVPLEYPAALISPLEGSLTWLIDRAAASQLNTGINN